jgi:hypothetical protein
MRSATERNGTKVTRLARPSALVIKESLVTLSYGLDVQQGLSFAPGGQQGIGHLLSATFFGTALTADLTVTDPTTSTSGPAAGVLQQVQWGETPGSPISMTAYLSSQNATTLQQLLRQTVTNLAVTFSFRVAEFDLQARVYYAAFGPQQPPLKALVGKSGSTLQLQLASTATTIKTAYLYAMSCTLMPPPQMQPLIVAASATQRLVKAWGITVSG